MDKTIRQLCSERFQEFLTCPTYEGVPPPPTVTTGYYLKLYSNAREAYLVMNKLSKDDPYFQQVRRLLQLIADNEISSDE